MFALKGAPSASNVSKHVPIPLWRSRARISRPSDDALLAALARVRLIDDLMISFRISRLHRLELLTSRTCGIVHRGIVHGTCAERVLEGDRQKAMIPLRFGVQVRIVALPEFNYIEADKFVKLVDFHRQMDEYFQHRDCKCRKMDEDHGP